MKRLGILVLIAGLLCVGVKPVMAGIPLCTIQGAAYDATGAALANGTLVTFTANPASVGGNQIAQTAVSTTVDANGNLVPLTLAQGLSIMVSVNNGQPFTATVPSTTGACTATLAQLMAGVLPGIANPAAPAVTVNTTGSTTYVYAVVAHDTSGGTTLSSPSTIVTNGAATANNTITAPVLYGAATWDYLKQVNGVWFSLALASASTSLVDTGQATQPYTLPTANTTTVGSVVNPLTGDLNGGGHKITNLAGLVTSSVTGPGTGLSISGGVTNGNDTISGINVNGVFNAADYTGTDDCVKTNAAISAAQTRGGGTVLTPGTPGTVATCNNSTGAAISIVHGTAVAPIRLVVREALKGTGAYPLIQITGTSNVAGAPDDTIECESAPLQYSVTNNTEPASGFDLEPTTGSTPIIEFGAHGSTVQFTNMTVRNCGFMGNQYVSNGILFATTVAAHAVIANNGAWISTTSPTGAFIATDPTPSSGVWDQVQIVGNFSQQWAGGTINWNATGGGGGGYNRFQSNFCDGAIALPCFTFNGLFGLLVEANGQFGGTIGTNSATYLFQNDTGVFFSANHHDSAAPAVGATGTAQVRIQNSANVEIGANTLNGNTASANSANWPAYGIYIDGTSHDIDISPGIQCTNTATSCIYNLGARVNYRGIGALSTEISGTAYMRTNSPNFNGLSALADYENTYPGTAYGALFETGGFGVFDGASTYGVNNALTTFGSSSSLAIAFKTGTTSGGVMAFLNPYVDPFNNVSTARTTLVMGSTGKLVLFYNSGTQSVASSSTYNNNAWHLAVITLSNSSGATLYVDGASVASNAVAVTDSIGKYWVIGAGNGGALVGISSLTYWQGSMDFVAEWQGTVLSSAQVAGITQTMPETTVPTGAGTIAALSPTFYWPFDADSTSTMNAGKVETGRVIDTSSNQYGVALGGGASAFSYTVAGTAHTVLHGNTSAAPTYSAVTSADVDSSIGNRIAAGTSALNTAAIAAGACATTVTTAATNVVATDAIEWAHNAAVTAGQNGSLIIHSFPTTGNVNFQECNPTAGSITPPADTLNWVVVR